MISPYHYVAFALFTAFALLDLASQARSFPQVRFWRLKGVASTFLFIGVSTTAPLFWDAWLGEHRLVDATSLPLWIQVVGAILLLELGIYVWHRSMHASPPLWRWFHQMHHSAERLDIYGAFYFSPLDMLGWAMLGSLCLVLGFGISGEAALIVALVSTFLSMFQHANIRTPHWLGYFIARPESHSVHHERGVHRYNFSDLPLWDMVFGTFRNPREWQGEAGFWNGASGKIGPMLIGRDVA
jgi:sterol desaturase/sphingolipid hydroxylase (fatty acid hydroxylase superfamily)